MTINEAVLSVGLSLEAYQNEQCGQEIYFSQTHACDLVGNYIGVWFLSDGVNLLDPTFYGEGRHIAFMELGAFTTINVGPHSDVSYDASAANEVSLVVQGPKEQLCNDMAEQPVDYPCFLVIDEGWITVDF